jgi:hypothetical protein
MALSREQKESLRARYEEWGLDTVKAALSKPGRDMFVDPEITRVAHTWVNDKVAALARRESRLAHLLLVAAAIECALVLALTQQLI